MMPIVTLNYLCFIAYSAFALVAICSGWSWVTGGAVLALIGVWLIYGIASTAAIQWHRQGGYGRAITGLYIARRLWR